LLQWWWITNILRLVALVMASARRCASIRLLRQNIHFQIFNHAVVGARAAIMAVMPMAWQTNAGNVVWET
jgi:hypothetical protein